MTIGKFDKTGDQGVRPAVKPGTPRNKSGGGTLLGVFVGLVIGVSIAFGVVWYLNKSPLTFKNKYEGAPKADKAANGANPKAPPVALPGKPGDKPAERQRFDFYNILEGKTVATPGAPTPAPAAAAAVASAPAGSAAAPAADTKPSPTDIFFLQVGSFQKAADADNLKAKLARPAYTHTACRRSAFRTVDGGSGFDYGGYGDPTPRVSVNLLEAAAQSVYVCGEVFRPGPVAYQPGLTMTQAIAAAGSFNYTVKHSNVRVLRLAQHGSNRTFRINMDAVLLDQSPDFLLLPGDVVYAQTSGIADAGNWVDLWFRRLLPFSIGGPALGTIQ